MRSTDMEMVLETYDYAENKRKAIEATSKLLNVSPEEIKEVLQKNGRVIDFQKPIKTKGERPTATIKNKIMEPAREADQPEEPEKPKEAAAPEPMPEYVKDVLMHGMDQLEQEIQEATQRLKMLEGNYKVLTDYIFRQ